MIIINAVESSTICTIQLLDLYMKDVKEYKLYVDDEVVYKYYDNIYPGRCVYDATLVSLWLTIDFKAVLVITRFDNIDTEIYESINNNFVIITIDEIERGLV